MHIAVLKAARQRGATFCQGQRPWNPRVVSLSFRPLDAGGDIAARRPYPLPSFTLF
jgi:hypothetical protein